MKNVLSFWLVALFLSSTTFGQTNSFIGAYNAYSIEQTNDNGFILAQLVNQKTSVYKLDATGKQILTGSGIVQNLSSSFITQTSDGGYLVTGYETDTLVNKTNVKIVKLTSELSISWSKLYGTSDKNERGLTATQTADGGYLLFGVTTGVLNLTTSKEFYVIKVDADGKLLWERYYASPNSITLTIPCYSIISTSDGGFLLHGLKQLLKISAVGDSLFSKTLAANYYSCEKTSDGKLIFGGFNSLMLTDESLNELWSRTLSSTVYSVKPTNDNGFILLGTTGLIKTNSSGDSLWNVDFSGLSITGSTLYKVITTKDNGYLASLDNALIKTDEKGRVLNLTSPSSTSSSTLYPGVQTNITWKSSGISTINIEFSSNAGKNWVLLDAYIPTSSSYPWSTPNTKLDSCLIQIRDVENQIYSQSQIFPISSNINNTNYEYIAANQILMWVGNNGICSHDPRTDGSGLYWPGGLGAVNTAIYQDGFIWGGKVDGQIRVGGSTYRSGLQPGKILSEGIADDPNDQKYSVWKIKKGWEILPPSTDRSKYEYNYNSWPGDLGAPFVDNNGDGVYTPGVDKPKFLGDEVLWLVGNDLDTTRTRFLYGSDPMGLEVQTTVFAFNRTNELGNVVFKNHKIINKSSKPITDMYLAYWSDPDLGDAGDDYVGCDTILSLGYCYNGDNNDVGYYGAAPPAVGYSFLQGPIVAGIATDVAAFLSQWRLGYKNLPLTAFSFYVNQVGTTYKDPVLGSYEGSVQMYNYLQGLIWDGTSYINPFTVKTTKFPLAGDPVIGTGWYEGPQGWPGGSIPPSDRRQLMSSGPFTLMPGDTQEVVIAISLARGSNNLGSITELKKTAKIAKDFYYVQLPVNVEDGYMKPLEYNLSQNYPNPFNPTTSFNYALPSDGKVTIKIYDAIGREVKTLVDEFKHSGKYTAYFNSAGLASGVYMCKLVSGNYSSVKKMILMK
ncbi:MAG: T9SS type A sorting domain-containing protein [Ignavibacteriaceae bacterium]|jgi:hypothetical protein